MSGGLGLLADFLTLLLWLFFFGSIIPSIVVLPCYRLIKIKSSLDRIFFVKHFALWLVLDSFGFFYITKRVLLGDGITFGDEATLQTVIRYGALYLIIKVAIYSAILFAKREPLKTNLIVFIIVYITQLIFFAGAGFTYTWSEEREPVPYYSNFTDFKGSVYIAISGDHLYKISKENELLPVAELPQKIIKPVLSATQDELFMLGFRKELKFEKVEDKIFLELFRLRDQQFVNVAGSYEVASSGIHVISDYQMDATENMLLIMWRRWELRVLEGEFLISLDGSNSIGSTPKFYHGKWHTFHKNGYLVEFSWDPKAKDARRFHINEFEKVYGSELPYDLPLTSRLYVIDGVLYGARGSVLYRRDNGAWKEYVKFQQDIYDVTGGNGFLFVDIMTGENDHRIVKINSNKEMEVLPLPKAIAGKAVLINSVLFKDDTLYVSFEKSAVSTTSVSFEKLGVFALSGDQWRKVPIKAAKH